MASSRSVHQPDLHLRLLMREHIPKREQNGRTRAAVVRPQKAWLEEGVVMARENENLLLGIRRDIELADDAVDGHRPAGRGGSEIVSFDPRAVFRKHLLDQRLGFLVPWRAGPPLAEGHHL